MMDKDSWMLYDIRNETRLLFNNPNRSDVRFLVGGQTVYVHKFVLAIGSPVFKSMFFGESKEKCDDVIEIKDLTPVGFMNALGYIYGCPIDYKFTDLHESFVAVSKYRLHGFNNVLSGYIKDNLNAESSCLIYDQLIKIGEREELALNDVIKMIIDESKTAFQSSFFPLIDQATLISLLSLDELNIAEIDLLAAVSTWVDCEVQRQGLPVNRENRRKVFEPIKGYVLFTALTPDQIANSKEVAELLTEDEKTAILNQNNPSTIEQKTTRRAGFCVCSVFVHDARHLNKHAYAETLVLSVNRRVSIRTIYSTYSENAKHLRLQILDMNWVDFGLKTENLVKGDRLCFAIRSHFVMEPNVSYILQIIGHSLATDEDHQSNQFELSYRGLVTFDLKSKFDFHSIRGLSFCILD